MVSLTFLLGYIIGVRVLKLDREMTVLTCAGSAICGAAAVLATESVIRAKAHHSALAVAGVVLFGTTAMFLYPFMFRAGFIPMDGAEMGVYIGASVHEVAHVVAAGNGIGDEAAANAAVIDRRCIHRPEAPDANPEYPPHPETTGNEPFLPSAASLPENLSAHCRTRQ